MVHEGATGAPLERRTELRPQLRFAQILRVSVSIIRSKMRRHGEQMRTLVSSVVVLDYDGTARVAGEIFDEPALARPIAGDELNGLLPARFFDLQDAMRAQARLMVDAAARHNSKAVAESFGALARSRIGCHDAYLTGSSE